MTLIQNFPALVFYGFLYGHSIGKSMLVREEVENFADVEQVCPSDKVQTAVRVRSRPSARSRIVTRLRREECALYKGERGGWYKIRVGRRGPIGYVSNKWTFRTAGKEAGIVSRWAPKFPIEAKKDPIQEEGGAIILGGLAIMIIIIVLEVAASKEVSYRRDPNHPYLHHGCFGGDTYILTKEGPVLIKDFVPKSYVKFPEVASFDESRGIVIFQRPTACISHTGVREILMEMILDIPRINGMAPMPLAVTSSHELLIVKDGSMIWRPAGGLRAGDALFLPEINRSARIRAICKIDGNGPYNLFDLSFSKKDGRPGDVPNFLVSPNGKIWIVAHNKV